MAVGGRAFVKPLPFDLGSNGTIIDYGADAVGLATAAGIGMKWWREEIPWNFVKSGGITGFEVVAGTYLQSTATTAANAVATIKAAGLTPLLVVTVNNAPGLSATWASGIPCTPAQLSAAMVWLVSQPGLQGLDWEILNEPDGTAWAVTPTLLYDMYALVYPAMKAADPTCTIHGLVLEAVYSNLGQGSGYYVPFAAAAGWTSGATFHPVGVLWDDVHLHTYSNDDGYTTDASPFFVGPSGYNIFFGIAFMRQLMVSMGDDSLIGISEVGWPNGSTGAMTPQLQAQFYQDLFQGLTGNDPVNGGHFSDYLTLVCEYAMNNNGANWGIYGEPAVAVLTEVVSGH